MLVWQQCLLGQGRREVEGIKKIKWLREAKMVSSIISADVLGMEMGQAGGAERAQGKQGSSSWLSQGNLVALWAMPRGRGGSLVGRNPGFWAGPRPAQIPTEVIPSPAGIFNSSQPCTQPSNIIPRIRHCFSSRTKGPLMTPINQCNSHLHLFITFHTQYVIHYTSH